MSAAQELVTCPVCGHPDFWLGDHLAEAHGISVEEFVQDYPDHPLESPALKRMYDQEVGRRRRQAAPKIEDLYVRYGDFKFPVNADVPESACLPLPPEYRLPTHGRLGREIQRALRYIACGRSTYIWGLPGSGKDALPSALCAATRTPSAIYQINPEVDIMAWFFTRAFDATSTKWEEGELLRQLRDGYTTACGRVLPYTIVLSDFDRAGRSQAEAIRLVTDSIQGRILGPTGETYRVFPGTQIILTANTMGGGDERGRMVSSNVIDGSILDRIERKVLFHGIDWRDEEPVIRAKFPIFAQKCGDLLPAVHNATKALRKAVEDGELYGEFSHRGLCSWIGDAEDILKQAAPAIPKDLLKQAFDTVADGFPDAETRLAAQRLVDPHINGGAVDRGDTSGIASDDLDI